jgi:SEC-C motif-containing protein
MADNALMSKPPSPAPCPCGGGLFASCCNPYLAGDAVPPSAEQLMRSRYSAFALRNEAYLRATWHASTLPAGAIVDPDEKLQWLGLEVKSALRLRQRKANLPEQQDTDSTADTVEFVARFKVGGRAHRLHEVSNFVREPDSAGVLRWFYVDGSFPEK